MAKHIKSEGFIQLNRRAFLLASAACIAACSSSNLANLATLEEAVSINFTSNPFRLGVASGEPDERSVVIWTRLATEPLQAGGGMPNRNVLVNWFISSTPDMKNIIKSGQVVAIAELSHSVHLEVDNLKSNHQYWYQFSISGFTSPVGRTRTMPGPKDKADKLKFAFASCQHFEDGFYNAQRHMAEQNLDLVIFLGDYIYEENSRKRKPVRRHKIQHEIYDLDNYRIRYAEYKMDIDLQAAHASAPWLLTHDDHEIDNNYADLVPQNKVEAEQFLQRRVAAYKAYFEHMPFRWSMRPNQENMKVYRKIDFGQLARFYLLDTRQYRSDQPCGDGIKSVCGDVFDEHATMLGNEQEQWLFDNLANSQAHWNVLAQQVMMAPVDRIMGSEVGFNMDTWAGYEVNRNKVINFLAEHNIPNAVVLTGDIHSNWVNELKLDYNDINSKVVATEFICTSLTSGGNGSAGVQKSKNIMAENEFVKFFNSERGYVYVEVDKEQWRVDFKVVQDVTTHKSGVITRKSIILSSNNKQN